MPEPGQKEPRKVLMCPPAYYNIPAAENPHMDIDVQPNMPKVWSQWVAIYNLYKRLGLDVYLLEPHPMLPDMIFTANSAWCRFNFAKGRHEFVLSNFRSPVRRPEKKVNREFLQRTNETHFELPEHIYFEGQGDMITLSEGYLFGHGVRSSPEALDYLRRLMDVGRKEIHPLKLASPDFYHLDTCCMSLRGTEEEGIVYWRGAFNDEGLDILRNLSVPHKFEIDSPRLAYAFACNSVFVGDTVLLNIPFDDYSLKAFEYSARGKPMSGFAHDVRLREIVSTVSEYSKLIAFLWNMGYKIIPVYTSEFYKSGAGIRCLTLFWDSK